MASPMLSKSAFKRGLECPRKLAYQRERYPSSAADNPYLEFLADGGFMVEAIARALHPRGIQVDSAPGESAAQATRRLFDSSAEADLFEAAFEHDGCSARIDILSRRGSTVDLIEIKAKSFSSKDDHPNPFRGSRQGIIAEWKPYLEDLAFQARVLRGALGPQFLVRPKLCIVDKARTCNDESIFSKIELIPESAERFGLPRARYLGDPAALAQDHFLGFVDASAEVEELLAQPAPDGVEATALRLAQAVQAGSLRALPIVRGVHCRNCEFRNAATRPDEKDGFRECWGALADASPHVLDLFRIDLLGGKGGAGLGSLLDRGVSGLRDIPLEILGKDSVTARRQREQILSVRSGKEWRGPGLAPALAELRPPYHFVDFETSRMAVPYHARMHPYEQVAFQFSCHTLADRGSATLPHREWINDRDRWPNVEFAEALRTAIGNDGQMLVWSDHERSALREIMEQIRKYGKGPKDLADWIEPLTTPHDKGGRTVDLYDICRLHYFHPAMGSKTSIKAVLKAIWQENDSLHAHPWFTGYLRRDGDKVMSPYEALPAIDLGDGGSTVVRDGTGAMRAYQDMVYGLRRTDEQYRSACRKVLLQYCKLDTLAMVMVWVHWMRQELSHTNPGGNHARHADQE